MGRSTVYNDNLATPEKWSGVRKENRELVDSFKQYCVSNDKSPATIYQYEQQLKVFFCWVKEEAGNRRFYDLKKRDYIAFFGYGRLEMKWSPNRLSSFRSVLSSLSNYVERVMDDEYPNFRNLIKVLEPVRIEAVREKTIMSAKHMQQAIKKLVANNNIQEACWLALLFSSGMRKSETKQMMVSYFTEENMAFDGLMYKTPKIRTKGHGVSGKQVSRYVFVHTFKPYLDMWLEERRKKHIDSPYLFVVKRFGEYKPADIGSFNSWSERIGSLLGIEFYGHCVRHAWTTYLAKSGYPKEIIQKLQNWSSTELVDVYDDTDTDDQLEEFFSKIRTKGGESNGED